MFNNISHIYFPVRDVAESIDFYTTHLGFLLQRRWSNNGRESAYLVMGVTLLELTLSDKTPSTDGRFEPRFGIAVDDIEAAIEGLRAKGVHVEREIWDATTFWGRQAMIKDPSGYVISLRQWRAPDGPDFPDWKPSHEGVVRIA
jgi:catechol 2,3-dioxygenase-like lactoylglutathione lyase family enzyme